MTDLSPIIGDYLRSIGRKGGSQKSEKKTAASRLNAKKGGWPKGKPRKKNETTHLPGA